MLTFILPSFQSTDTTPTYLNTPAYCQIDGTIYKTYGTTVRRYSNAFPEGISLCLDPLCTHHDTFCTEFLFSTSVVTDGKKLYIRGSSYNRDNGTLTMSHRQEGDSLMRLDTVYQLDPTTGEIKQLVEFAAANGRIMEITTDGKYVYYVEAFHKDKTVGEDSGTYGIPMRVPCKSGEPEEFLEGDYSAFAAVYADKNSYYVTDEGLFTEINRSSGEKVSAPMPCVYSVGVIFRDSGVYLYGAEEEIHYNSEHSEFLMSRNGLWKWDGGGFVETVSGIDTSCLVWDEGGVWYQKMLPEDDFVILGSNESYDGRGMSLFDFVRTTDGMLYYYDLATGEETAYSLGNVNMSLELIGVANGYIIALCINLSKLEFAYEMKNLKPEPDGTVTFYDAIKPEE